MSKMLNFLDSFEHSQNNVSKAYKKAKSIYENSDIITFESISNLAFECEKQAILTRNFSKNIQECCNPDTIVSKPNMVVSVAFVGPEVIKISGPALISKRAADIKRTKFIASLYKYAFEQFCFETKFNGFEKYVISLINYQQTVPAHCLDNDNFEVSDLINLVALYFSKDHNDNMNCSLFQSSAVGNEKTDIYITTPNSFREILNLIPFFH